MVAIEQIGPQWWKLSVQNKLPVHVYLGSRGDYLVSIDYDVVFIGSLADALNHAIKELI